MATSVHSTAVVYPNVQLGDGVTVGEYVVLGTPPRGASPGEHATVIGADSVIRSHTVIYAGNIIGAGFQSGHATLLREFNHIGDQVSIGSHTVIEHHVEIGDGVRIHSGAFIPEYSLLEPEAWVGPHVTFTNTLHPLCPRAKDCLRGPRVRRGAKIGANATLLPDLEVGEMALVGAAAVVVQDVPARMVVVGNPARVVRSIDLLTCPYGLMDSPYNVTSER
ncbi:MAG: transferase [Anaerolineae bacterium]|nr:transferase [Anaerolineae bacterium]